LDEKHTDFSGSKLFAKIINRIQNLLLADKELKQVASTRVFRSG